MANHIAMRRICLERSMEIGFDHFKLVSIQGA
jgi:hypothetical protein